MKNVLHRSLALTLILISFDTISIDNPHFYRATFFWGEPRFEAPWLTSIDVTLAGGATSTSRKKNGEKTTLLNIFGPQNMHQLAQGIPDIATSTNPLDIILKNLLALPNRRNFGQLKFLGRFHIIEAIVNCYQNLINGFFLQAYLPIRHMRITNTKFRDLSPTDSMIPNRNSPEWTAFLNNFKTILARYNINAGNSQETGVGDLAVLIGWSHSCVDTCYVDFVDVNAKIGILFPTGAKKNEDKAFSLPLGYNKHVGLPLKFDLAIGLWEWFTFGTHIGALFLFENTQNIRMKTGLEQNGFITLTTGRAQVDPGTIWDYNAYIKADHFCRGLSFLFGYSYNRKDRDVLEPKNIALFDPVIVNHDQVYRGWDMHVLQFIAEYDFAKKNCDWGPRISLFYNLIVGGNKIFNTSTKGISCGIDIASAF